MSASRLEIRLLGGFELSYAGQPIRLASRPAQSLLAFLILTAGETHRREKLAGMLWPEASEFNARGYLRSALWQIRKALDAAGLAESNFLLVDDISLGFNPGSSFWLDASGLEQAGGEDCAVEPLAAAVGLYRSELLPGFYDEWVLPERQRLQALFEQRAQRLLACLIDLHQWLDLTTWAEFWIARSPTAEVAYRALMLACDDRRDLAGITLAYERCRAALQTDLGVEPAGETNALFARLQQRAKSSPADQAAESTSRVRLPPQITPIIGREDELAEIGRLLQKPTCRLLTLVGPGGAGKSRLALEAASRARHQETCPDGIYFVPLEPLRSAEYIESAIARALGISFYGPDELARQIWGYLRDKQMLLVLDSFEHLLASDGHGRVAELMAQARGIRLLVTSRERLNLQGEWLFEVRGLAVPVRSAAANFDDYGAVQLFVHSAERSGITVRLPFSESDRNSLLHICRLVDGMPLALELAAAWVRVLTLEEIAGEIENNLAFLSADRRDLPERHRSLQAVFDYSWQLLSASERAVFRQLAVFRGGFTRDAAASVAGASLTLLSALVNKSLLHRSVSGRFEIHELLRQYAETKLREAGETQSVGQRHRNFYLALVRLKAVSWGAVEVSTLKRVEAELENLRAALSWSRQNDEPEERLMLAGAVTWFWFVRADYAEGRKWLEDALRSGAGASNLARAMGAMSAGSLAAQQGDYQAAGELLHSGLELWREGGIEWEFGWTLQHLGRVAMLQGEFVRSAEIYRDSLKLFRKLGHASGIANGLMYLGTTLLYQGDDGQAESLLEESVPMLREVDDAWALARALYGLGLVTLHRRDLDRAMEYFRRSLLLATERRDQANIAQCLEAIAWTAAVGDPSEGAVRLLGAADGLRAMIGLLRPPGLRGEYERNMRAIRSRLDETSFAQAWSAGRLMDEAETLELALALAAPQGR